MKCKRCGKTKEAHFDGHCEYGPYQFEPSDPEAQGKNNEGVNRTNQATSPVTEGSQQMETFAENGQRSMRERNPEAAPAAERITNLVADNGPRVDTRRFPLQLQNLSNLPPEQMTAHSGTVSSGMLRYLDEMKPEAEQLAVDPVEFYEQSVVSEAGSARPEMPPTLEDYKNAPSGIGPLAEEWKDKPHRLIYDLVKLASPVPQEPSMECWNCHAEIPTEDRELIVCHDCHYKWRAAAPRTHHEPLNAVAIKLLIGRRNNTPWDEVPDSEVDGWLQEAARICKLAAPRTQGREPNHCYKHPVFDQDCQHCYAEAVKYEASLAAQPQGGEPEMQAWREMPIGHWFFHESPECTNRYSVQKRTDSGCTLVCSTPWHHDSAKSDMQTIAKLHNSTLLAQARTQPAPKCPKCGSDNFTSTISSCGVEFSCECGFYGKFYKLSELAQFFTTLPEAQPTNKEEPK